MSGMHFTTLLSSGIAIKRLSIFASTKSLMKINKLTQRLQKNRPMTMVSIRIPEDVIDDLKYLVFLAIRL